MEQSIVAPVGVLAGGGLVMVGDHVRRRAERRHAALLCLVEACAQLSTTYSRLCGELVDWADAEDDRSELPRPDALRYEAATRFFLTPGSEQLSRQASALINAYRRLREESPKTAGWKEACAAHGAAVRAFEGAVRAVVRRGTV
ncbi:hypothetical protein [Streptomyces sp. TR06-5]|uniref:hypothetical protein n=1 Tax=Streptomyces sp. TR06-5 TaxID=3385976 RepID=UPI0039A30D8E